MYMSFIDLEKVYNRVNRKDVWQVLRPYDMDDKLLSVDTLDYIRVKERGR